MLCASPWEVCLFLNRDEGGADGDWGGGKEKGTGGEEGGFGM